MCFTTHQVHELCFIIGLSGDESRPVIGLKKSSTRWFGMPIKSAVSVVETKAPDQRPRGSLSNDLVKNCLQGGRSHKAEFPHKIRLFTPRPITVIRNLTDNLDRVRIIMMRSHEINIRIADGFLPQRRGMESIDDQVVRIEALNIGRDLGCPRVGTLELITRFPRQNCLVVPVESACDSIFPINDVIDGALEIIDQLPVCPEIVFTQSPESSIFRSSPHPDPVIHERYDYSDMVFICQGQKSIQGPECLLIEFTGTKNIPGYFFRIVLSPYGDGIRPHNLTAHLPNRPESIFHLIGVRQPPGIRFIEEHIIFYHMQIGYVERDEAEFVFPIHQLITRGCDEVFDLSVRFGKLVGLAH